MRLEIRLGKAAGAARQHGAPEKQKVTSAFRRKRLGNLPADLPHVAQVQPARVEGRSSHADDGGISRHDRLGRIRGCPKPPVGPRRFEQLPEPGLDDRRIAAVDQGDLVRIHIDTDDVVPPFGETRSSDAAHITQTEYTDFHCCVFCWGNSRCSKSFSTTRRAFSS